MVALRDTNAYTAMMRGDEALLRSLEKSQAILMASIVMGERDYGFRHGSRYAANRRQRDLRLAQPFVSFVIDSRDTAHHHEHI